MGIPVSVPTDKLHKFLAVAGLLIVGFGLWLGWKFGESMHATAAKLHVELALIQEDMGAMQRRTAIADSLHDDSLRPSCDEVEKLHRRLVELTAIAEAQVDAYPWWNVVVVPLLIIVIGFLMAVAGFREWHTAEHEPPSSKIIRP